ncbi:tRNA (adenosine(37)-N6)-threonylcarbamoyltransferase complex transferase subunit TsaD [Candidatus Dependentiae bacterium]|nr:tRNA (adenosine(37)-N6)-threonylcarbamoyltransferase complex transferase subunit TsaD [Candidatus Dependentiae bacterium]
MKKTQYILGIESSCDETAAAIIDHENKKVLSNKLHSQTAEHKKYGGVVPEIASRSHLEKIDSIVDIALKTAGITLDEVDAIAVTNKPGLAGSLLTGLCFAKGLAWAKNTLLIPIDHTHGHITSAYLNQDGSFDSSITFPLICLSLSGGHSSIYFVESPTKYITIGSTIDDAAGEAFDKISKILELGYPGGPIIEKLAQSVNFEDFFSYTRTKDYKKKLDFTFSGLKTAVFYDMIERGYFDLTTKQLSPTVTEKEMATIASSLLVCIGDIICAKIELALSLYPQARYITFVGGVACNKYLSQRLQKTAEYLGVFYKNVPREYSTDNAAMIAAAGSFLLSDPELSKKYFSAEWRESMMFIDINS